MHTSELTVVALLPSPEKPPATNYAAVRSFPLFLSLTRGSRLSAAEAQARAWLGCAASWAAPVRFAGRRVLGPAQQQ